ncbi:GTP cyclohydrolase II [Flexithrix dorotheae]|uniref:GTP cyclohydrolase II n=1 Tax=Flexithrix dorotheae TaxID=70993 RepID=UPI000371D944|nr:GTP cyclohydrolase II [Flexithrix dorotheae]
MIKRQAEANIPNRWGNFRMIGYAENENDYAPHFAMVHEKTDFSKPVTVRVHSECITGDLFGSFRCDCGEQLEESSRIISKNGGIILYLRQEGRGIGILNKLRAYVLQDKHKLDTVEANEKLGLHVDLRDYSIAILMLEDLGIKEINLLTNNPDKIASFDGSSIKVVSRLPIIIPHHDINLKYLKTKQEVLGHMFKYPSENGNSEH